MNGTLYNREAKSVSAGRALHFLSSPISRERVADLCATVALVWIGRLLLGLTAISLATMPLTQHLWTWDRFLHGGQDFELGALMVLSVLALVLVLSKQGKQHIDWLFAVCQFLRFHSKNHVPMRLMRADVCASRNLNAATAPISLRFSTLLQI